MRSLARILLAFFAFTIEVKVKAEIIEWPSGCLKTDQTCAIHIDTPQTFTIELGDGDLSLGKDSVVVRKGTEAELLQGQMLVSVHSPVRVVTRYADLEMSSGRMLVKVDSQEVQVTALNHVVKISLKGHGEVIQLTPGFSVSVKGVDLKGFSIVEVPQPLVIDSTIRKWARLHKGDRKTLREEIGRSIESWRRAVREGGQWHQQMVERSIASHKEQEARKAAWRAKVEQENQALRRLFRQKNYLE